jgi:hypothetical protein
MLDELLLNCRGYRTDKQKVAWNAWKTLDSLNQPQGLYKDRYRLTQRADGEDDKMRERQNINKKGRKNRLG